MPLKKLPPLFGDSSVGPFRNDRTLTAQEIDILAKWAAAKAPEVKVKHVPPAREWVEGRNTGKPDIVVKLPKAYEAPATGTLGCAYFILPSAMTKDTWGQGAAFRPGQARLIQARSDVVVQLRYTTNGRAANDRASFGLCRRSRLLNGDSCPRWH